MPNREGQDDDKVGCEEDFLFLSQLWNIFKRTLEPLQKELVAVKHLLGGECSWKNCKSAEKMMVEMTPRNHALKVLTGSSMSSTGGTTARISG